MLALSGGTSYAVQLNGRVYNTTNDTLTVPLSKGDNKLVVTTDKICQGIVQQEINLSDNNRPYPNPFSNTLYVNLNLSEVNITAASIKIYSVQNGRLMLSTQYANQSGLVELDMSGLGSGIYSLHLLLDGKETVFKIYKK